MYIYVHRSLSIEEDASTYNSLGALYFNTGRHQKAKRSFSRALALDPRHLEAQCSYVRIYVPPPTNQSVPVLCKFNSGGYSGVFNC